MERKKHIDLLKFLGITGIIIAHISAPRWLMFLRSFDVPLMVFISAYLANGSYEKQRKKGKGAAAYYLSRFKRLVLPVWGFLIFYFFLQFVKDGFHLMGFRYYLDSFLLTRYGIAYVWIMLIYLYSALLVPVFDKAGISIKTSLIMLIIYAVYELCYRLRLGTDIRIIETTFYYIIPYGMVTYLGYGYDKMTKRTKLSAAVLALVSFAALALYYGMTDGAFRMVSKAKYPPRLYYLSYGMAVTFFLFLLTEKLKLKIYDNPVIKFVSRNSMWIYLWHILVIDIYTGLKLPEIWWVRLLTVYIGACCIVKLSLWVTPGIKAAVAGKFQKKVKGGSDTI